MNKNYLYKLIKVSQSDIKNAPEGLLRVSFSNNTVQYGIRYNKNIPGYRYLKKDEIGIAKKLAQKEYAQKVLKKAIIELEKINKYEESKNVLFLSQIYESYSPYKRDLICRYDIVNEDYIQKWCLQEYTANEEPFDKNFEIITNNNIRVRSVNERQIANALLAKQIPFRYEYPHVFKQAKENGIVNSIKVCPDFTILNPRTLKEYIWEHFGMMERERYRKQFYSKLRLYQENGFYPGENLIMTFSEETVSFGGDYLSLMIEKYLK